MSEANGTAPNPIEQLKHARAELKLARAKHECAILERRTKKIQESNILWDWMSGYQDLLDRLRTSDGKLLLAPSTVQDRRHGANWPHWRTWQEHSILRAQSRFLATVSDIAFGALSGLTSYVVGDGMTYLASPKKNRAPPPSLVDRVQEIIDLHVKRNGHQELEQEMFKRTRRDGEAFTRYFARDDGMTDVRIVEPEMIIEDPEEPYETGSFGLRNTEGDLQSIEAYHVCYDGIQSDGEWVDASEMRHLKVNVDRGIKRGMPDFVYDTHDGIKSAGRCVQNMVESAAIQAAIAEIRQHAVATRDQVQTFADEQADFQVSEPNTGRQVNNQRVQPGTVRDIPAGLEYVPPPFSQGGQSWIAIVQASLRRAGVKWNAPEWLTSADASNNNYASALVAESPFYRRCTRWQGTYSREYLAGIELAVKNACDAGIIRADGSTWTWEEVRALIAITAEPPSLETRNLLEETQRNQIRVQAGVLSPQTWSQQDGLDYEQEQSQIAEHTERTGQGPGMDISGDSGQGGGLDLGSLLGAGGGGGEPNYQESIELRNRREKSLMEALLLEAGFTGVKTVSVRGKEQQWHYQDGKRVAAPKKEEPKKEPKKKPEKKPEKPAATEHALSDDHPVSKALAALGVKLTPELLGDPGALAGAIRAAVAAKEPPKPVEKKPKSRKPKDAKPVPEPAPEPAPAPVEKPKKKPKEKAPVKPKPVKGSMHDHVMSAMGKVEPMAPHDMEKLRASVPAEQRAQLDEAIWDLVKDRKVFVQRDNHPALLTPEQRAGMLSDGDGGYYGTIVRYA